MAFQNFGYAFEREGCAADHILAAGDGEAHVDHDRKSCRSRIHRGVIAADDACLFHFANTFGDSWRGETDAPSHFRKREARILLQLLQNAPTEGVEEFVGVGEGPGNISEYLTIIKSWGIIVDKDMVKSLGKSLVVTVVLSRLTLDLRLANSFARLAHS